ncbi:Transposase [Oopsacas minuta]|uniref:Transposase n=1 Tax=Oopsacas minuta TaxID=111878 RepID=A0AAV7JRJ0_9METZ|nr:Transposase [Oopsacas minuta]
MIQKQSSRSINGVKLEKVPQQRFADLSTPRNKCIQSFLIQRVLKLLYLLNLDNFNLKWRAYLELRTILKIQPIQIFSELQEILCVDCHSRSTVERWAARFRSGDADVTDLPRSGRLVSATTSENIALIESMVMEDKCITVNQLQQSMEISSEAIHTILTTELGYRSICGKWTRISSVRIKGGTTEHCQETLGNL